MSVERGRIIGLDVVRSAAILGVLVSHFLNRYNDIRVVYAVANTAGVLGVQLFFVLSGFLIGGILLRRLQQTGLDRAELGYFWMRRWFRTLPNYFVCLLTLILLTRLLHDSLPAPRKLVLFPLFLQNMVDPTPVLHFFSVSWSLSVEEWAYLSLPLLLMLACALLGRADSKTRSRAALGAILFMILAPLIARLTTSIGLPWDTHARKLVVYRLDSIGIGVLLAYIATFRPTWMTRLSSRSSLQIGLVLVVILWAVFGYLFKPTLNLTYHGATAYFMNGFWSTFVDLGMALIVAYFSTVMSLPATSKRLTPFFLGCSTLSYSLYLWHAMVIEMVNRSFDWNSLPHSRLAHLAARIAEVVLYTLGSWLVAMLMYRLIEKPGMDLRERFKRTSKPATAN